MPPESPTREMEKTSTILSHYLKVAAIQKVISEWSRQEQIEALHATLMEVSNPRPLNESVKERNNARMVDSSFPSLRQGL